LVFIITKMNRLQFITTNAADAEKACKGGVRWVQLRVKNKPADEWQAIALETKKVCAQYGATFIVNDNVEIAKAVDADGVHLGKEDMQPDEARKILGNNFIIGGTANTMDDIRRLNEMNVDYIGLGPFRFTSTKANLSPVLGINGYAEIILQCAIENTQIPVIAIGGIQLTDIEGLLQTGVNGIAVSSAIAGAEDIEVAARNFIEQTNANTKNETRFANHSR
jgi:thiamine-phosphate pyrophosphorylase